MTNTEALTKLMQARMAMVEVLSEYDLPYELEVDLVSSRWYLREAIEALAKPVELV